MPEQTREEIRSEKVKKPTSLRTIFVNKWAVRAYALIIFIVAWQIVGQTLNPIFFSPPGAVAVRLVQLLENGTSNGIPANTLITIETVLAGFIPAAAVGVPLGILIGRSKTTEYSLDPYISLIYAVPIIVMIPILELWFGSSMLSDYILVFIASVLPITINSISGAKNVGANLVETGESFGYRGAGMWRKIIFPASLPYVMAGLRIGIGHAVIGAILAELFMYTVGLGNLIEITASEFDISATIAVVIVTILLGLLLTELVKIFERRTAWSAE